MKITISHNFPEVQRQLDDLGKKANSALREALNRTAEWGATCVGKEMLKVFDRPTMYTRRSLRVFYANTSNLKATLWFRQRSREADESWAVAQISGGQRQLKPMEMRLQAIGVLPKGWMIVPGQAAPLDGYGNMSRGEISRILNVLGSYTEAGYNKANAKTRDRLRKGNAKKNQYGFEYWVNPVGRGRQKHLLPGVYRRVYTGFGTSLKPMMIFVAKTRYKRRLDFFSIVQKATDKHFPAEFEKALRSLMTTGSASALRRQKWSN